MNKEIRAKNAKLRRELQQFLTEARGCCEKTVTQKVSHVYAFEKYFNKDLTNCGKKEYFIEYKTYLRNEKKVSLNTLYNNCRSIYDFYLMLSFDHKYKKVTSMNDLEYLSITKKEKNAMESAPNLKEFPRIEDFKTLVDSIDVKNEISTRNKAYVVFSLFSPSRGRTTIHLKLKHLDRKKLVIQMDPTKEVDTKGSRGNWGMLLVFEPEYLPFFTDYVDYLIKQKGFSGDHPLFPATLSELKNSNNFFTADRLSDTAWKTTAPLRRILKNLCNMANLKYYKPHRYRDLHYYLARKCCINEEQRDAVEKNMGHRGITTAEKYYGNITKYERFDILSQIDFSRHDQNNALTIQDVYAEIRSLREELIGRRGSGNKY
ncbi:MAG: hypothetical protein QQN41_08895 [Nitrosopumilus sp.]